MEGKIKDLGLNFLRSEGTKVRSPGKRCEVIGSASPIGPWIVDGDKINEVHGQLDADKFHILAARVVCAIDHRQKDQRIGRVGRVVDFVPRGVMEAQDMELGEVAPAILKVP